MVSPPFLTLASTLTRLTWELTWLNVTWPTLVIMLNVTNVGFPPFFLTLEATLTKLTWTLTWPLIAWSNVSDNVKCP